MDESDFEGTLVLEKLALVDKVDDFYDAIDADDAVSASRLLKLAHVDAETIAWVVRKMAQADGTH
ncbi:MAG TPA: hypothetical protein VGO62_12450 [Myxococcota bacterium]|jgi:hypothetical protein